MKEQKRRPAMIVLFLALVLGTSLLGAQQKDLIVLQNADEFIGSRVNGEDIRELRGHVRFTQGNVRVWCDKAFQYLMRNEVELIGNVKVVRDTVTLTAARGRYYGDTKRAVCESGVKLETQHVTLFADYGTYFTEEKRAEFYRNVRVIDSTTTIFSDQLLYYEKERKSIATLNVRIVNSSDNITLFGDRLDHFDETHYSKLTEHPRMMQIDTSSKGEIDTLAVKSIIMESYDDSSKRLIAVDSVAIVRGQMAARCQRLDYFRTGESITLNVKPVVWYEENQITGDTISLFLRKSTLERAFIRNRAFAISQSDSAFPNRYNQLTGREIRMRFVDNAVKDMQVDKNAISLYFLFDDKLPNGVNKISGDFILMNFVKGKPDMIRVQKGIEGIYYPENMVEKDEMRYNLDGFLLRTDRPKFDSIFSKVKPI